MLALMLSAAASAAPILSMYPVQTYGGTTSYWAYKAGAAAFGSLFVGSSKTFTIPVINNGTTDLMISSIVSSSTDVTVNSNCAPILGANLTCSIYVVYTPTTVSLLAGTLTIYSNAPTDTVSLSGTGVQDPLVLSQVALNFSAQTIGAINPVQTVVVTNTSATAFNLLSILSGTDFPYITTCAASLAAGASCNIDVHFSPSAVGVRTGALTIITDASLATNGSSVPKSVSLSGSALIASQTLTPIVFSPNALVTGSSAIVTSTPLNNSSGNYSGLPASYSSLTPGVCTVSNSTATGAYGGTVNVLSAGICTIAADQAGSANYNPAATVTQSVNVGNVGPASQSISFGIAPGITVGGTGSVTATSTSGLVVIFSSLTPAVCTVSGQVVTRVTMGTCTIAADQAGNTFYTAATQHTQSLNVSQSVTFGAIPAVLVGGVGTLSATATSALPVSFGSITPSVCTVSGNAVTSVTAGNCTITADQSGDATYSAATTVTQTFLIGKYNQIVSFPVAPTLSVGGSLALSATANSGLVVTYGSLTPANCSVNGSTITGLSVGTGTLNAGLCAIVAQQAGDASYNPASSVTQYITIVAGTQTISAVDFSPATLTAGGTTNVSATSNSATVVRFVTNTPSVCSVTGSVVTGITTGNCYVTASQLGNGNFSASNQFTQNIAIKTNQSVLFGLAPTLSVAANGIVLASATSALAVSFSSSTPNICTISGNAVTGVAAGACIIAADQAGDAVYNPAPQVTQNITVKATQTVSFGVAPMLIVGGNGTILATTPSGAGVSLSSISTGVCTISGSIVTAIAAGQCVIYASGAGNASYNPAPPVYQYIIVGLASQTIGVISFSPATLSISRTSIVSASGGMSGNQVVFSSTTPAICNVTGSTLTGVAAGICTIAANQAGNANYSAAGQASQSITVTTMAQSIVFAASPASTTVGGSAAVSATGGASGLAVVFSSNTPAICVITGSTVTGVAAGVCTIAANQAGDANYSVAAQATQNITVVLAPQVITFGVVPPVMVGGTGIVSATGGASGNAVVFSSSTPTICTIIGSTVTGVAAGACTLAAVQSGNANYYPATQVMMSFSVTSAATAPAVSLSMASLLFASQSTGAASTAQTVTLTNSSASVLSISGIVASGDFTQSNNCGLSVAIAASCNVSVVFTPTLAGVRTGSVIVSSNAAGTGVFVVSLSGTGVAAPAATLNFLPGWNLLGNSANALLDVATTMGDPLTVTTVWKWIPATSKWAFYAPSMTAPALATYAASKNYDVLSTINGGEGFWVNAKVAFAAQLPAGNAISSTAFADQFAPPNRLPTGWSMIATGDNVTTNAFVNAIALTAPVAPAVAATSLTTLWAWDAAQSNWYFYAPSLDNSSGLAAYIASKSYLNFGTKTLAPDMGFWVNHP